MFHFLLLDLLWSIICVSSFFFLICSSVISLHSLSLSFFCLFAFLHHRIKAKPDSVHFLFVWSMFPFTSSESFSRLLQSLSLLLFFNLLHLCLFFCSVSSFLTSYTSLLVRLPLSSLELCSLYSVSRGFTVP